jgi:hypothetical protein
MLFPMAVVPPRTATTTAMPRPTMAAVSTTQSTVTAPSSSAQRVLMKSSMLVSSGVWLGLSMFHRSGSAWPLARLPSATGTLFPPIRAGVGPVSFIFASFNSWLRLPARIGMPGRTVARAHHASHGVASA